VRSGGTFFIGRFAQFLFDASKLHPDVAIRKESFGHDRPLSAFRSVE
jgi:hypothetical protein